MPSPNYISSSVSFDGVWLDPSETPSKIRQVVYEGLQALRILTLAQELRSLIELMDELGVDTVGVQWSNGKAEGRKATLEALLNLIKEADASFETWRAASGGRRPAALDSLKEKLLSKAAKA